MEGEEDATPAARRSAPGGPRRRALRATEGLPPALLPDPRSSIHQQRVLLRDQRARRLHAREVRQPARRLPGAGQAAAPRRSQEARPAGARRPQAAQLAGLGRLQHQRHRHVASTQLQHHHAHAAEHLPVSGSHFAIGDVTGQLLAGAVRSNAQPRRAKPRVAPATCSRHHWPAVPPERG